VSHHSFDATAPPTQIDTPAAPIQAETPAANVIPSATDLPEDLPEDALQTASTDEADFKPKRKRNNNNRVSVSVPTITTSLTDSSSFRKSKLLEWLSFRDTTLDEILRHDGLGDYLGQPLCCACNIQPGLFKCKDCSGGGRLRCQTCVVKVHQDTPLHQIEVSHFVNTVENVKTNMASYCSDGQANFLTRIPSKTSVSAYNLVMVDVPARVHPLGLPDLWFLIHQPSMP
jgi:hypothetical protein